MKLKNVFITANQANEQDTNANLFAYTGVDLPIAWKLAL
jgi:hypothetical protein